MAAQMGALGMNYMRFLSTADAFERSLMIEVAKRIGKYHQQMNHSLAVDIANSVGQLFKK